MNADFPSTRVCFRLQVRCRFVLRSRNFANSMARAIGCCDQLGFFRRSSTEPASLLSTILPHLSLREQTTFITAVGRRPHYTTLLNLLSANCAEPRSILLIATWSHGLRRFERGRFQRMAMNPCSFRCSSRQQSSCY